MFIFIITFKNHVHVFELKWSSNRLGRTQIYQLWLSFVSFNQCDAYLLVILRNSRNTCFKTVLKNSDFFFNSSWFEQISIMAETCCKNKVNANSMIHYVAVFDVIVNMFLGVLNLCWNIFEQSQNLISYMVTNCFFQHKYSGVALLQNQCEGYGIILKTFFDIQTKFNYEIF